MGWWEKERRYFADRVEFECNSPSSLAVQPKENLFVGLEPEGKE